VAAGVGGGVYTAWAAASRLRFMVQSTWIGRTHERVSLCPAFRTRRAPICSRNCRYTKATRSRVNRSSTSLGGPGDSTNIWW